MHIIMIRETERERERARARERERAVGQTNRTSVF